MGLTKDGTNAVGPRHAWEPPKLTRLAIAAKTKSSQSVREGAGSFEPQLPSNPSTKLGFSFEMALPLSARSET